MKINKLIEKYGIKAKAASKRKNIFEIKTEIDENDGDYLESTTILDISEFELLLPVLRAIESGEFTATGDCSHRDDYTIPEECEDAFYDIDPSGEYGGHDLCIEYINFYDEDGVEYEIEV